MARISLELRHCHGVLWKQWYKTAHTSDAASVILAYILWWTLDSAKELELLVAGQM